MQNARNANTAKSAKNMKKKKRSAFNIFVRRFVQSTLWLIILIVMGIASYKVTIAYYDATGGPKDDRAASIINEYFGDVPEVEDVSKNLILSQNDKGEIKHIVLGIFNMTTENLDYITIPVNTRFTISNELYQKLYSAGSEVPQIMKLEDADQYFSDETLYEYMVILLEDMLGIDIGYYTVISKDQFNWVFTEAEAANHTVYQISDSFFAETQSLTDEKVLKEYLKDEFEEYHSNLSLKSKYEYVPGYLGIQEECIYSHGLYGTQREDYFEITLEDSKNLIAQIADNSIPYTEPQNTLTEQEIISSKGYNIEILNGSGITGLAALYEEQLKENGYTVTHIGNYTLGSLTESRIIVKEKGMGQDLLSFVGKGTVKVGELPEGVDIQILLGTMAEK